MESSVDRVMNWTAGVGSRPNCWAKRLVVPATGVAERSTSAQYRPGESRSGSSASSVRTGTRMSFRKQARYSRRLPEGGGQVGTGQLSADDHHGQRRVQVAEEGDGAAQHRGQAHVAQKEEQTHRQA